MTRPWPLALVLWAAATTAAGQERPGAGTADAAGEERADAAAADAGADSGADAAAHAAAAAGAEPGAAGPAPVGTAEDARALILRHGCTACHEVPRIAGFRGRTGPPLTDMARRIYVAGVLPNTPDTLARFIADPQAVDPRSAMPDLGLSPSEAAAIAAFLLEPPEEDAR